jgi:hypothetical protein
MLDYPLWIEREAKLWADELRAAEEQRQNEKAPPKETDDGRHSEEAASTIPPRNG